MGETTGISWTDATFNPWEGCAKVSPGCAKLIRFTATNFKALSFLEIDANGNVITLSGDNGSGKSSLLQALASALGGKLYQPERPVHEGAAKAELYAVLEDGTKISVTIRPDGGRSLEVIDASGSRVPSPQAWLDRKIGALSFDPLAFAGLKSKDQAERLRQVIGLDLTAIDAEIGRLEVERLGLGRDKDRAAGAALTLPRFTDAPAEMTDLVKLHMQIQEATSAKSKKADLQERAATADAEAVTSDADVAEYDRRMARRPAVEAERVTKAHGEIDAEVAEWQRQAAELRRQLAALDAKIDATPERKATAAEKVKTELDTAAETLTSQRQKAALRAANLRGQAAGYRADADAVTVPDVVQVQELIAQAQSDNDKVTANRTAQAADNAAEAAKTLWQECQDQIVALRKQRLDTIRACKMPVDGLGFDDDGTVTMDGRPLADASHAQQVIVGMAIALAGNPELRIVLMDEANSLDRKSLALVAAKAAEMNAQVWMARIEGGDGAIVIEDGERQRPATVNAPPAAS